MNTDKDANPRLKIADYEVIVVNCQDSATAHALAGKRLEEIEQRLAEIKKEKTALNRDKHCLTRWLHKNGAAPNATVRGRQLGCDSLPLTGSRACVPRAGKQSISRARQGLTRSQKLSAHALSSTGPRRFLIVEFDFVQDSTREARLLSNLQGDGRDIRDLSAALLLHLAEMAPLTLAVYSGGKSLHGWFYCAGIAEENVSRFYRYAAALGADRATWVRSQFARMPDGLRDNGKRQSVYFFNPGVLK